MDILKGLIPESVKNIPVHMDFEGQKKAERCFQIIIVLFAGIGFIWGYLWQQFSITVYVLGAGFALSCLLTLPPWPCYRNTPLVWQKTRDTSLEETASKPAKTPEKSKSSKRKK